MDKKVELQVLNITNSQAQVGAFALLLGEVNGERQLPIIIGPAEAQATALYMKGVKTPRPLTHDLFMTIIGVLGASLLRVLIYKAKDGIFYSYIYLKKDEEIIRIDTRTSDAVGMAIRAECPILIMNPFWNRNAFGYRTRKEDILKSLMKKRKTKRSGICLATLLQCHSKKHWSKQSKTRITNWLPRYATGSIQEIKTTNQLCTYFILPIYRKTTNFRKRKHNIVPASCGWVSETKSLLRTVRDISIKQKSRLQPTSVAL